MGQIDTHLIYRAITGIPEESGDTGLILETPTVCFAALVDALGHGKEAHDVAISAKTYLKQTLEAKTDKGYSQAKEKKTADDILPAKLIEGVHRHLKGSRGAVAAICRLEIKTGKLICSGMGNIDIRTYGSNPQRLVTRDGVLGYMIPSPKETAIRLHAGDALVMSSDGIKTHFDPLDYPDLFLGSAREICRRFIRHLSKQNDDASCIVMRYGK